MQEHREQFLLFRRDLHQKTQRRREMMSLPQRLSAILAASEALSDVSAAHLDGFPSKNAESLPPPLINGCLNGPSMESVTDVFRRRIQILVEGLEREVDNHRYVSTETSQDIETRILLLYRGEYPAMVVFLEPSLQGIRKAERYVMKLREKHGLDPLTGR